MRVSNQLGQSLWLGRDGLLPLVSGGIASTSGWRWLRKVSVSLALILEASVADLLARLLF